MLERIPISSYQEEDEFESRVGVVPGGSRRRTWDDEFVLKRQFSALIPAFDPRPGRTNVNQTQDFDIPAPGSSPQVTGREEKQMPLQPQLQLFIKGPVIPGVSVDLVNDKKHYNVVKLTSSGKKIIPLILSLSC